MITFFKPTYYLLAAAIAILTGLIFFSACGRAKFGKAPSGARLERIQKSPNHTSEGFVNQTPAPALKGGGNLLTILIENLMAEKKNRRPKKPIPSLKTDLKGLDIARDVALWLGHSSLFLQLSGKRILIDPVFSSHGSPFFFINRTFPGSNVYKAEDMPFIDYLIISHDHWDHLDYETAKALRKKVGLVICPLGVGEHFEYWGFEKEKILEGDWYDKFNLGDLTITLYPARHFSGRFLTRNNTLWAAYGFSSPKRSLFFSGDSGYGPHFRQIRLAFGADFDWVFLDGAQYDRRWPTVHMIPEQSAVAAIELGAKALVPIHVGKFALALHPWFEPFERLSKASVSKPYRLITPLIGQAIWLDSSAQLFEPWWQELVSPIKQ